MKFRITFGRVASPLPLPLCGGDVTVCEGWSPGSCDIENKQNSKAGCHFCPPDIAETVELGIFFYTRTGDIALACESGLRKCRLPLVT